jgi:beta-galactosidase/beta-glucuronidase
LSFILVALGSAQEFTRGVGVYPGNPAEDFAPTLRADSTTYRNLALRRPAYQSSAYDYNLTAQLVTDGIKDTKLPRWVSAANSENGVYPRFEREWLFDDNSLTGSDLKGPSAWVQAELDGGDSPLEIDRLEVDARTRGEKSGWTVVVSGSEDGRSWNELGRAPGVDRAGEAYTPSVTSVAFQAPSRSRFYRVEFRGAKSLVWHVAGLAFFRQNRKLGIGGPYDFTSAWKSAGASQEWVYVDLGAPCTFDRVALHWIRRAAEGAVQVSDDAASWKTVQPLTQGAGTSDDFKLTQPAQGRYVRVLMTRPVSPEGYILSELEVYGRGGMVAVPKASPAARSDGRLDLAGGAWRVQRDSEVNKDGTALSEPGFPDADWVVATVPGTVLSSYWNAGALPDPNFGDNQLTISDSYFYSGFWYRNEFTAPAAASGRHIWLNFAGINWKADVFLNGRALGRIEGGFMRGRFDVTSYLRPGGKNALAVRVERNANPGSVKEKTFQSPDKNGGILGADNPTYHATIGWDWIPTVRGRDIGIWKDVYLTATGPVAIENPLVHTTLPLPDTSRADVYVEVTLRNYDPNPVTGVLRGRFGDVEFQAPVTVEALSARTVKFDPSTTPALRLQAPRLWWPNGYGDPNLYPVELKFETAGGAVSDATAFQAGVRQFTYSEEGQALKIWINGRRLIPRGGNWGFGESMLRYRAREYDIAVRYHREMNYNMIRNWVGQIGDDEFYEACDRHGIVVWQDYWLANPNDGPDPDDNNLFLRNARDYTLRIRNHPSIGLYCGRNEGYPPKPIDDGLRAMLAELAPGLHYIGSSADDVVSGHGPYQAMPVKYYFTERATPKFHSEMGMPNIVSIESLRAMMPEGAMWPQGDMWGLHDFSLHGAQGGASFIGRIDQSYGGANSAAEWVSLAQFVNYEGYRAMYEAQSKRRMGLLIWMSHSCWPSFVWQTYDYYFEPTAAYFAVKKASEPLHVQWNPVTDSVEVVNYSGGNVKGLTAQVRILNLDGSLKWEKSALVDSAEDSTVSPIRMEYPSGLSAVYFLQLRLTNGGRTVSENFYWRGTQEGNYQALRDLPKVSLEVSTRVERQGDVWHMTTEVANPSKAPALMVRLKPVREKSGDRILPAIFSDNYIALMPGERRTITIDVQHADTRGERPQIVVGGFNVGQPTGR